MPELPELQEPDNDQNQDYDEDDDFDVKKQEFPDLVANSNQKRNTKPA